MYSAILVLDSWVNMASIPVGKCEQLTALRGSRLYTNILVCHGHNRDALVMIGRLRLWACWPESLQIQACMITGVAKFWTLSHIFAITRREISGPDTWNCEFKVYIWSLWLTPSSESLVYQQVKASVRLTYELIKPIWRSLGSYLSSPSAPLARFNQCDAT